MSDSAPEPISDLYSRKILELGATISRVGRLSTPSASADAVSRLCGSRVTVDLALDGGKITDFAHEVKQCALGQAASSVMAREIVGSTPDELRAVGARMRAMLREGGAAPEGRWSDLAVLEAVRDYRQRHGSVLLTFDAVEKALAEAGA